MPSKNSTVPAGMLPVTPAPFAIVAVNVTAWPGTDGLAELLSVVVVALPTRWMSSGLLLAASWPLPR